MTVEIEKADLDRAAGVAHNATRGCSHLFVEAYSAACLALFQASESFDGRGTWSGYSGQRMRWAAIDEVRRQLGKEGSVSAAIKRATSLDAMLDQGTKDDYERVA
ncbi:Sigma-70 region 2 [Micrococcales bacterium KH10]|nr:Sigma-70 region 2 [Micrococcales bacterium KH10]